MTKRARPSRRARVVRTAKPSGKSAHQLWGGRFSGVPHPALEAVNRSIDVDFRLWPFDIELSKSWANALVGASVLTRAEGAKTRRGLERVARRVSAGARPVRSDEDVHTMIDRLLH